MKLRNKVIFANMIIVTAVLAVSSLFIISAADNANLHAVYQYYLRQSTFTQQYLDEYLRSRTNPASVFEYNRLSLKKLLEEQSGCEVTVSGPEDKGLSPVQSIALKGKKAYFIDESGDVRKLYLSFPIYIDGRVAGAITFEQALYREDSIRRGLTAGLLILFIAALLVSLLLSLIFSYRIIKPLELLTKASEKYSKGLFQRVAIKKTGDEIENLASSFNTMGHNIDAMFTRLREEQEKQKSFLDSVTHELRTPLTNILGYVDLSTRINDEEKKKRFLSYISDEGSRLLEMVNKLLELSRLGRYDFSLNRKSVALDRLTAQVCDLMSNRAQSFGISLETDLEPVTADVDDEKIKQVLINLIDNAIKHSEGSKISIKLYKEDNIQIVVSDNGKGMPEAALTRLVEPFYRIDKSRSRKNGGSGLGLSICSEIIKAHKGSLNIASSEGKGTTVTISLQD